jgi:thymidylate synthase ThyX
MSSLVESQGFRAEVIARSVNGGGIELVTYQLRYPRFIHAEAKTHRVISQGDEEYVVLTQDEAFMDDQMLSRNASSSRAIPVAKMIEQVRTAPAMPVHWGKNQPGMQAYAELAEPELIRAQSWWLNAARAAADIAERMNELGAHKQVVNRILEPFQFISVIVTATEWDNFFHLRDHEDAQPEIRFLARMMKKSLELAPKAVYRKSRPESSLVDSWHLPYVLDVERAHFKDDPGLLVKISAARCARVSYLTHEGKVPNIDEDLKLYDRLVGSEPLHASPTEHQAIPARWGERMTEMRRNFRGWIQHREEIEQGVKA